MIKKLLIGLLIGVLVIGYGNYGVRISKYRLDVTYYSYRTAKISHPVQIALIADVHDEHCLLKKKMVNVLKKMKPDLILCAGDIIDNESPNDQKTLQLLTKFKKIAPVYMSLGNHEIDFYENHKNFYRHIRAIGVKLLEEEYRDITVNGNVIRISGMYNYAFSEALKNEPDTKKFLKKYENTSHYKIMMAHRPDSFIYGDGYKRKINLVVSGHFHGGQVVLPLIGGLYAPDQGLFPKYDYGKYRLGKINMVISRGLASSTEKLPRFNNPGEIVSITLK